MSRHVVFGTGQVGALVARRLLDLGHEVVAVNRSGRADLPGARVVGGDATDPAFTTGAARGADAVYFCLNASGYTTWAQEFPPLQRAVLAAARSTGARLVVLDNLYAYGPTGGRDLDEGLAARPTSTKAATRAAMTAELLASRSAGEVDVVIGRASDYFGPGTRQSALGDGVFAAALAGRRVQVMGDPDTLHSYSYTPDVAAGLVTLGTAPSVTPATDDDGGAVWHLPVAPARTTRAVVEQVCTLAGHRPRLLAAGATTLRLLGLVSPQLRELRHTLYQFTDRWVVDDSRFRAAFGQDATPLDTALAETLRWFRDAASARIPA